MRIVQYSDHCLNNRPFDYQTTFDHLNTKLVRYSDPYCIQMVISCLIIKWSGIHMPVKLFAQVWYAIKIPY